MVAGVKTVFTIPKRSDSVRATWIPQGEKRKKLQEEVVTIICFVVGHSLEDHLLGRVDSTLSWMRCLQIAQGAALGLAYLHEEMNFQLIFRDLKTSNILLDDRF